MKYNYSTQFRVIFNIENKDQYQIAEAYFRFFNNKAKAISKMVETVAVENSEFEVL